MASSQTFTFNIKAVADMKDVTTNIQNIQAALGKLKLPDNLKSSFRTTFTNLDKELVKYQNLLNNGIKTKTDANALEKSGNNIVHLYDDIVKKINSLDNSALKKAFEDMGSKEVERLRQQLNGLEADLRNKLSNQKFIDFSTAKQDLQNLTSQFTNAAGEIDKSFKTISNSTINTFFKNIDLGRLDLAEQNLAKIEAKAKELNNVNLNNWVQQLRSGFDQLKNSTEISSTTQQIQQLKQEMTTIKIDTITKLVKDFNSGKIGAEQLLGTINNLTSSTASWGQAQAQTNKELDQVKSRIQYFFGLNNAIQLVRRSIRDAVNTVKELDKAMTETAVVTDFSVADMWTQLPEYTKRANELGVTTKAAYEAATLYYQQGLNTNEVMAISNETLKMARIAGLDAAEATDRMTNAIRGFNMEINESNAQRIDDVYSKLAAITASNTDEISTAMTKVASLAHNANMEFETTAAFLAQIIETTRESAETAGTALKTVVARFSEVKKLVDEGALKGADEEGELIDVNKVSQALRTAGIDLNKYFLGEVGLDDIFMELASKWDSLTTLQQRYIATQAAGSRQQSRFIALMSNYARTQELVSEAYNAEGAAAEQFAKTQDSLESKLARLKNAWDRFTMGLANNVIIKAAVDGLTLLLNTINNLTEAFGEGTSSILKMATAFLTLKGARSALKTGGIVDQLLVGAKSSLLGNTTGVAGGYIAGGATASKSGASLGQILGGSLIGKGLTSIGTGIGGLLGKVGMTGAASTLAAGGTAAMVTGLGAVAAAAGVAYIAYKKLYSLTPEGQLEALEKEEQRLKDLASEAQKTAKAQEDALETYQSKDKQVADATNGIERMQAIKERNDYILSLLEKDNTYAKYIQSLEEEGGQIVLTLNEEALAKAAEEAAKAATEAAIDAQRTAIKTDLQDIKNTEQDKTQAENLIKQYEESDEDHEEDIEELRAEIIKYNGSIQTKTEEMRGDARALYQNLFTSDIISSDIKNQLSDAFSNIIEITGTLTEDQAKELEALVGTSGLQAFLDAINNVDTSISLANIEEVNDLLNELGLTADNSSSAFNQLAKILNLDTTQTAKLNKRLKDYAIQQRKQQETVRNDLQQRFQELNIQQTGQNWLNNTQIQDQARVNNLFEEGYDLLDNASQKNLFEAIFNSKDVENEVREAQVLLNSINLDKPISAYKQLQAAINDSSNAVRQELAQGILNSNKDAFSTSNMVISALKVLSTEYEDVQKQVDKLIKKNGKLTADDIIELAESCGELQDLLEEDIISAEALAAALTMIEDGTITFDGLSDAVINAIENTETFINKVEELHDFIANWEEGADYGEGIDFFTERVEDLQELIDNFEFGNPKTKKIWEAIFGEDYMTAWLKGEDTMREKVKVFSDWIANDAHGFFTDQTVATNMGLTVQANGDVDWPDFENNVFNNWDEVIASVKEGAMSRGLDLTDEAAMAIIEAWVSHGDVATTQAAQRIDNRTVTNGLKTYFENTVGPKILTDSEIDALAAEWKIPRDKLIELIKNQINDVDVLDENTPIDSLTEWVKGKMGASEKAVMSFLEQNGAIIKDENNIPVAIDADKLKLIFEGFGVKDPKQQAELSKAIAGMFEGLELNKNVDLPFNIADALGVEVTSDVVQKLAEAIENATKDTPIEVVVQKVIIKGLSNVTPGNQEVCGKIIADAVQKIADNTDISITALVNEVTAQLTGAGINPDDPDFYTTIGTVLSAYYKLNGKSVPLTVDEVKAGLKQAGVNLSDAELDKLAQQIIDKANDNFAGKEISVNVSNIKAGLSSSSANLSDEDIDAVIRELSANTSQYVKTNNEGGIEFDIEQLKALLLNTNPDLTPSELDTIIDNFKKNSSSYITAKNPNGVPVRIGTVEIVPDAVKGPSAEDLQKLADSAGAKSDEDIYQIVCTALLQAGNSEEEAARVAEQYQAAANKHKITYNTGLAGNKIGVSYDYQKITGTESTSGANISEKYIRDYEINIEDATGKALEEATSQVGKITLTFETEEDYTSKLRELEQAVSDGFKIKITEKTIDSSDVPAIEVEPVFKWWEDNPEKKEYLDDPVKFPVTAEPKDVANVSTEVSDAIASGFSEGSQEGTNSTEEAAEQAAQTIFDKISTAYVDSTEEGVMSTTIELEEGIDSSSVTEKLEAKLAASGAPAGLQVVDAIASEISNGTYTLTVSWQWSDGQGPKVGSSGAMGGYAARAGGGNQLKAGPALTGEEGQEIVWNKERGYAYITGEHGPEFRNLNPGDRVFDANETRKIMRNSMADGGLISSYATGRWNPANDPGGGGGGGSNRDKEKNSGSDREKSPTEWKNELDWLYNLMEDIDELERKQTEIQEDYEDYLKDQSKTGKDLYNLLIEQLGNLYTQLNHNNSLLSLREREMREFMDTTNKYDQYLWYNWEDRTIEIDWDAIEAIKDKETYEKVKDLVSEAESIQDKMDDAEDKITDIENQIQELENIWRDTYTDFESRVLDAVIGYYQKIIDNYSELNDTLNDSASAILNSLQKQISLERQIRDNTKTEQDIGDTEARLAFLRRDTTGGHDLAALQLSKELDEQRQDYEDNLIDQAIAKLQEDNDAAAEQRQKQIDIMQAQLDYQQQNGDFNQYVRELLESAMGADGELLTNSDLMKLLKDQENWSAMSDVSKEVWEEELNSTFKEVSAFILKQYAEENGTFISALTGAIEGMTAAIGSKSQPTIKIDYGAGMSSGGSDGGSGGGSGGNGGSGGAGGNSGSGTNTLSPVDLIRQGIKIGASKIKKYAIGGLSTDTGLAWIDGTPSEPEYVLNARQTEAFLHLADVLPDMTSGSGAGTFNTFGGIELNLVMNVDQIASDYDVDRIADRVKDIVYNAGQYRNVNTLNFIR